MARIRSIHPDQWCDEDFVELPMEARLLAIGLRNFADDKGIFEWKPKTIKMKIFPADDVDIDAALDALLTQNQCVKFTSNSRHYGAIKNFCKFQRPKKPNNLYPISSEIAEYVGYKGEIGTENDANIERQIPHQFPTSGEIAPQMEKEREGSIEVGKPTSSSFAEFWSVWPNKVNKAAAERAWKKLSHQHKAEAVDSASAWFKAWRKRSPDASPIHPATFLNNRRWEDEPQSAAVVNLQTPRHGEQRKRSDGQIIEYDQHSGWQEVHV